MTEKNKNNSQSLFTWVGFIFVSIFALFSHLSHLVTFPVFADEAIYIRWAQLIMDDWQRYLFFPLNDGKTPLFIWLLAFVQNLFADQLFAARFVSVLIGLLQIWVIKKLLAQLGAQPKFQVLGMFLAVILPFWYFQAHVALMDGLLTLFLSLTMVGCLQQVEVIIFKTQKSLVENVVGLLRQPQVIVWTVLTGLFLGLAFWTKLPALFFIPVFPLFIFFSINDSWPKRLLKLFPLAGSAFLGLAFFAVLRVSPAFGQLFHRGNDFAYPVSEVLLHGLWKQTLANIPSYFSYFLSYLTPGVVLLSLAGLFSNRSRRKTVILLLAACIFMTPLILFGKVIYARYLFPAALFITLAAVLNLQAIYQHWIKETLAKQMIHKFVAALVIALLLANTLAISGLFITNILFSPDTTSFVSSDRAQYLEDWSSGQGIWETTQYIQHQADKHSIAVATEGRFGTLPDGLLLYFHNQNVQNIYIEGTGQYPVKSLPDFFTTRAKNFDQSILVVNSNRMEIKLADTQLLGQYCRPHNKACLQIWDITSLVKKSIK